MHLSRDTSYNFDLGPIFDRLIGELYYPYEIEVRMRNSIFLFGRFSVGLIGRLVLLAEQPRSPTILFRSGAFCEAHPSSKIIVGGEHRVSSVSHNSAGVYGKLFSHLFSEEQKESLKNEALGVTLGDGVILSADTTVVDGVRIAEGAVLAAGAVAVGACEAFGLYGGVPARWLKQRLSPRQIEIATQFDLAKVRGHCLPATAGILRDLEHGDLSIDAARGMVDYMDAVPRIVMAGTRGANNEIVLGGIEAFRVGERTITDPAHEGTLRAYFDQARGPRGTIQWSPDIFHAIGIA
jgi:acetyltransferase-like isoleucine patch superfamily enzyme